MAILHQRKHGGRKRVVRERQKKWVLNLVKEGYSDIKIATQTGEHLSQVRLWRTNAGLGHNSTSIRVGNKGEAMVLDALHKNGIPAIRMPPGSPFDIDAAGIHIEVKTASRTNTNEDRTSGVQYLRFNTSKKRYSLYGHTYEKNYQEDCDFLVATWLKETPEFWVIPSNQLPTGLTIVPRPSRSGKYVGLKDRFDLIAHACERVAR